MNRGFYIIMAAQFFSSLADNALLVAAIALLVQMQEPAWLTPLLKLFFVISYVLLAPFVGALADRFPKGRVMFVSNTIKVAGCLLMLQNTHPLLSYAIVGLGAAAYSPAKYGILTEFLPPSKLVIANGWIEGLTVSSIILGTVLGGLLLFPSVSSILLLFDLPMIETGVDTPPEAAISVIAVIYVIAAIINMYVPDTGVPMKPLPNHPFATIRDFMHCNARLWKDHLGQISLAVTTLFWGAGATLQFIVLKWAEASLGYALKEAAILQGVVAVGIAIGAVTSTKAVSLDSAVKVIPLGILMGIMAMGMNYVHSIWVALPLLVLLGALAGFFVVPMNALLQHRGHILMGAGRSIAVQNFNENLSILVMLALYALLVWIDMPIRSVIFMFGGFVALAMIAVKIWQSNNFRLHHDAIVALLEVARSEEH